MIEISIDKLLFSSDKYNTMPHILDIARQSDMYKRMLPDIKDNGIKNPLVVYIDGDKYRVVLGNNRMLVAMDLGYESLPCIIMNDTDKRSIINKTLRGPKIKDKFGYTKTQFD